jgi:hypothetical protein
LSVTAPVSPITSQNRQSVSQNRSMSSTDQRQRASVSDNSTEQSRATLARNFAMFESAIAAGDGRHSG